jgi:hypothetical protein
MAEIRSEILNTGHPKVKAAQIDINGRPSEVFELLIDPTKHPLIDGSNSVKSVNWGPEKLTLGSKFGMRMRIGIPYRITNYVTEFDQNDKTRVVESFDGRPSPYQWWLRRRNAYKYVEKAIAKSLVRLKRLVEEKG